MSSPLAARWPCPPQNASAEEGGAACKEGRERYPHRQLCDGVSYPPGELAKGAMLREDREDFPLLERTARALARAEGAHQPDRSRGI